MWPDHAEAIEETVNAEEALEDAYTQALHAWAPHVQAAVLPELDGQIVTGDDDPLTAAATEIPPNPDAVGSTQNQWDASAAEHVLPVVEKLWDDAALAAGIGTGTLTAALSAADLLAAAKSARDDFTSRYRDTAAQVPAAVRAELQAIIKRAPIGTTTSALRSTIRKAITPGSALLRDLSRRASYHAAGILNHALTAVAKHTAGADRLEWLCVHPDTVVSAVGVTHLARRRYEGTLVSIRTASGSAVALTPQHRVLTGRGWVAAQLLHEGDELFKVGAVNAPVAPHVQDGITVIGDVVDAAMDGRPPQVRSVARGVDFDGHTAGEYVDVVAADRDLPINIEPAGGEMLGDLLLADADSLAHAAMLGARHRNHTLGRFGAAPVLVGNHAVEGGLDIGGNLRHPDLASGGLIPQLDTGRRDNGGDQLTGTTVSLAEREPGSPGEIRGDDLVSVGADVAAPPGLDTEFLRGPRLRNGLGSGETHPGALGAGPQNSRVAQPAANRPGAAAQVHGDFDGTPSGGIPGDDLIDVEPDPLGACVRDRVVRVGRIFHSGYVYDLSTRGHWYTANGLIAHNSILDERTRDTHWEADGQVTSIGGMFVVGGSEMEFPGDHRAPIREWINCVTGEALVSWPGQQVSHATKRRHRGAFVHLLTADGHDLTITANHPVLTDAGYVTAHLLRPGDHVIASDPLNAPQVDHMPARADEVYRAFRDAGVEQRVVASGVDFHHDALEGDEVSVVRADGDLSEEFNPGLLGGGDDAALVGLGSGKGDAARAGSAVNGRLDLAVVAPGRPGGRRPASLVGGPGDSAPTLTVEFGEPDPVGFAARTHRKSLVAQETDDGVSAYSDGARHLQHAYALGMKPSKLTAVDVYFGDHDVFNFSTTQQFYFGNGIAVHNCRCRLIALGAGEEPKLRRVPAEEAAKRAKRGVVHAEAESVTAATEEVEQMGTVTQIDPQQQPGETYRTFTATTAFLGVPTTDRRMLHKKMDLKIRAAPRPLMWMSKTGDGMGGHQHASTVGVIESEQVKGNKIVESGYLLNTPDADEAAMQLAHKVTRPSVDLGGADWQMTDEDGNKIGEEEWRNLSPGTKTYRTFTAGELMGTTLVSTPAFGATSLTLHPERETRDVALVAAAVQSALFYEPRIYPASHFSDPQLPGPAQPTMLDDGRIVGHIACWGACHRSVQKLCQEAPRSPSNYSHFHTSPAVRLDDGTRLPVGRLTIATGHADGRLSGVPAQAHYDNTGSCWALVRAGEDEHGIWVSGIAAPWADADLVEQGLSAPLSGDWRDFGAGLDLIAALSVNTPGFVAASGFEDEWGQQLTLVASLGPDPTGSRGPAALTRDDIKRAFAEVLFEENARIERESALTRAAAFTHPPTHNERVRDMLTRAGF